MTFEELIEKARKARGEKPRMYNSKLVQEWWPTPKIRIIDEQSWGDRHSNNGGVLSKFECFSFSRIGFGDGGYRGVQSNPKLPGNVCLAYGESPEQAYDKWCEIFNVWNYMEDWT